MVAVRLQSGSFVNAGTSLNSASPIGGPSTADDPCEVAVAGHQSGSNSQSCSRHPQIVLIKGETLLLAGRFQIGVEVCSAFRDRLATECVQELKTGFFEFGAAFASR